MRKALLIIGIAAASPLACKQDDAADKQASNDASETKSLENFTRADGATVKTNVCGMDLSAERFEALSASDQAKIQKHVDAPTPELTRVAVGTLAAVPQPLQSLFFAAHGQLVVAADAAAKCAAESALTAAERKFAGEGAKPDGCWRVAGGKLEVIVAADPARLRHGLVRLFSYVYTQFVGENLEKADLPAADRDAALQQLGRLKKQRSDIADALLKDVKEPTAAARLAQLNAADRAALENMAVAEAVDQYYCSSVTFDAFKGGAFPATWAAFTTGPAALAKDLGKAWHQPK